MHCTQHTQGASFCRARRFITALMPVLVVAGCEGMSHTDKGVLGGAGVGALAGGLVGHALGNTGAGAAIGAVTGGIAGGVTGAAVDKAEAKAEARAVAAVQQRTALQLPDVAQMTQQGISDAVIIEQIRVSGAIYRLSSNDILWLQQNGVHEPVIREMQQTAYRAPAGRVVYTQAPVYVVDPYYPPPPPVGVGVGVVVGGGRRGWR